MKKIILLGAIFAQTTGMACSYFINQEGVSKQLAKVLEVSINGVQKEVIGVHESNFNFKEINTTGMCPDAIIYNVEFKVDFKQHSYGGDKNCSGTVEVEMFSPWSSSSDKTIKYSLSEFKNVSCI